MSGPWIMPRVLETIYSNACKFKTIYVSFTIWIDEKQILKILSIVPFAKNVLFSVAINDLNYQSGTGQAQVKRSLKSVCVFWGEGFQEMCIKTFQTF